MKCDEPTTSRKVRAPEITSPQHQKMGLVGVNHKCTRKITVSEFRCSTEEGPGARWACRHMTDPPSASTSREFGVAPKAAGRAGEVGEPRDCPRAARSRVTSLDATPRERWRASQRGLVTRRLGKKMASEMTISFFITIIAPFPAESTQQSQSKEKEQKKNETNGSVKSIYHPLRVPTVCFR